MKNLELHPGTVAKVCVGCDREYVVIEELAEFRSYCDTACAERHTLLKFAEEKN